MSVCLQCVKRFHRPYFVTKIYIIYKVRFLPVLSLARGRLEMEPGGDGGDVPGGGLHGPGVEGEGGVPVLSDQPVLLPVLHTALAGAPVPGHHLQPGAHSVRVLGCRQYLAVAES